MLIINLLLSVAQRYIQNIFMPACNLQVLIYLHYYEALLKFIRNRFDDASKRVSNLLAKCSIENEHKGSDEFALKHH